MENKKRVLQTNLNGDGGAFSLIYQIQNQLKDDVIFDFFWMGKFEKNAKIDELKRLGSKFYENDLRKKKIRGHLKLRSVFLKFLKSNKYDVVHINCDTAFKMWMYASAARKAKVSKIILHSHSSAMNGKHKVMKTILHLLFKPLLKKKEYIFVSCSDLATKWMYGKCKNAIFIKNGVCLEDFKFSQESREKIRKLYNLSDDKVLLGVVGNLSFQKNPEFAVEIMKLLNEERKYILMFVGDGKDSNTIKNLVISKGIEKNCIFTGNVGNVSEYLSAMDIYLMPSRFEGLPVSAIEAQANGLHCLLSNKISKLTCITRKCKMLDLDSSKTWYNEIININPNYNRNDCENEIKEAGFDIENAAMELKQIYLD